MFRGKYIEKTNTPVLFKGKIDHHSCSWPEKGV